MSQYRFEDSIAWQKAQELAILIYQVFREQRDFGFRDQVQRAAVSISNNIAEGFERTTLPETKYFMGIAKGSCGEVRSMIFLACKLGYITTEKQLEIQSLSNEISKLIYSFLRKKP